MSEAYRGAVETPRSKFEKLGLFVQEGVDASELHTTPNFSGLGELRQTTERSLGKAVERFREYAASPLIRDSFGNNHDERRSWRKTLSPDLSEYYRKIN